MNLSEIKLHLYKVGTQILMGLHRFDHIIVTAEQALDLVQNSEWEDSPHKALYAAKSDEAKQNEPAPHGMGLLTCLPEFDHAAHLASMAKKPAPQSNDNTGNGTKPPAAPKADKKAKGGAKPPKSAPPKTSTAPATEQKPEVAEDTNTGGEGEGRGVEGDNNGDTD